MKPAAPPAHLRICESDRSLEGRDDDELMLAAAAGLHDAYAALVRRHHRAVRAYCARMSGSAALGDELAQDVFLRVWQKRACYEPRGRFKSYLFTVAQNRCHTQLRRDGRPAARLEECPEGSRSAHQLEELLDRERRRRVHDSVAKLPEEQRDAIVLRYTAGLEYEEIAHLADRPEATIRTRVFLGLARLRKLLKK